MKINTKNIFGLWFCLGTIFSIAIVFIFQLHMQRDNSSWLWITLTLGGISSYIVGYYCGSIILTLPSWHIKNWLKATGYSWLIAAVTLYTISLGLLLINLINIYILGNHHLKNQAYIIKSILFTPIYALSITLMGLLVQPFLLILSAFGGQLLFLMRNKIHHKLS